MKYSWFISVDKMSWMIASYVNFRFVVWFSCWRTFSFHLAICCFRAMFEGQCQEAFVVWFVHFDGQLVNGSKILYLGKLMWNWQRDQLLWYCVSFEIFGIHRKYGKCRVSMVYCTVSKWDENTHIRVSFYIDK